MDSPRRLRVAVPKKGRLRILVEDLLRDANRGWHATEARKDVLSSDDGTIEYVFLPSNDIALYVGRGVVDVGITGHDLVMEAIPTAGLLRLVMPLPFSACRLSVLVPQSSDGVLEDLAGCRVGTSFPHVAAAFFSDAGVAVAEIVHLTGSVESSVGLGLVDAVVELVESGTTMRQAGLKELCPVLESTAVVVAAPADSDASGRDPAAADPMEAALDAFAESLREGLGRRPDAFVRLVVEARGSARETVAAAAQEAIGGLSSVLHVSTHTDDVTTVTALIHEHQSVARQAAVDRLQALAASDGHMSVTHSPPLSSVTTQTLIPSIDLLGGATVQLVGGDPSAQEVDAGDPGPIADRFGLVGEIAVVDLDAALGSGSNASLITGLLGRARCRVGGGIRTVEAALQWLDAGASKVVIGTKASPEFLAQLPRDRVVVALDARHGEVVVEGWTKGTGQTVRDRIDELRPYAGHFLVTFVEREGRMGGVDPLTVADLAYAVRGNSGAPDELASTLTVAGGITTVADLRLLDKLGVQGQVGMALYSGKLDLADAFLAAATSDRSDRLLSTVVVDERGTALGLCYSNNASVRAALETRRGVYWSRKRGLWPKGETSGDHQDLLGLAFDCDRDTLRAVVRQHGNGFCHNKWYSCFGGARSPLEKLFATLAGRAADEAAGVAPDGSYTRRLLSDPGLLCAKITEEAQELVEADTADQVCHEACDVMFFAFVRAVAAGLTLGDLEREFEARSLKVTRRGGNAKPLPGPATQAVADDGGGGGNGGDDGGGDSGGDGDGGAGGGGCDNDGGGG